MGREGRECLTGTENELTSSDYLKVIFCEVTWHYLESGFTSFSVSYFPVKHSMPYALPVRT